MRLRREDIIICIPVCLVSIVMIVKNYMNKLFWSASLLQILTFSFTVILSFMIVQRITDRRRKIDCYDHFLSDIQNIINTDTSIFSLSSNAMNKQKSVANRIKYLCDHSFPQTHADLEYISKEFTELRELYDNHKQNENELKSIEADMNRHKGNISDKIDKLKLVLFDI